MKISEAVSFGLSDNIKIIDKIKKLPDKIAM
jgi:hypothetical protein